MSLKQFFRIWLCGLGLLLWLIKPAAVLAQNRAGINIGTKFSDLDKAIQTVGRGGWVVVIAGGTGDCPTLQDIVNKTNAAGVNLIIRGHLGNQLTPPDALGWTATLGSISTSQKIYFMPWNEPNQVGSADYGNPVNVVAYTNALKNNLQQSGVVGKIVLLSPQMNPSNPTFSSYIASLGGGYFNGFDGVSLSMYDISEQNCGQPLCETNPYLNPALFSQLLSQMGASGKPAFGGEAGTAGNNFYFNMPPNSNSPLYRFVGAFLNQAHPAMFAIPSYDLAGEVGHTWSLFSSTAVTGLLASEPDGGTTPSSFNDTAFQAWLKTQLDNGDLISCGDNNCGYAPKENPDLCTSTGGISPRNTNLTSCVNITEKGNYGSEISTPIEIKEKVTYQSNQDGTTPNADPGQCFKAGWTADLGLDKSTFQIPWAYYLNQYLLGPIDTYRIPSDSLDPLQYQLRDAIYDTGPLYRLTDKQIQDKLKNDFLEETVKRIEQSQKEGKALTAYISSDLKKVYTIGPWSLEDIYNYHNVYKNNLEGIKNDDLTSAIWKFVPLFANEDTEGSISFSAVDMAFDPNPVLTKVPEVYRLNKISEFLDNTLGPEAIAVNLSLAPVGPIGEGEWSIADDVYCNRGKESVYILSPSTPAQFNFKSTIKLDNKSHSAGLAFRILYNPEDYEYDNQYQKYIGYGFSVGHGGDRWTLWKTQTEKNCLAEVESCTAAFCVDNKIICDDIPTQASCDCGENELYSLRNPLALTRGNIDKSSTFDMEISVKNTASSVLISAKVNGVLIINNYEDKYHPFFTGGVGISIYNNGFADDPNANTCFSDIQLTTYQPLSLNNPPADIITAKTDNISFAKFLIADFKEKVFSVWHKINTGKINSLLASSKLFQPADNLLAQADCKNCVDPSIINVRVENGLVYYDFQACQTCPGHGTIGDVYMGPCGNISQVHSIFETCFTTNHPAIAPPQPAVCPGTVSLCVGVKANRDVNPSCQGLERAFSCQVTLDKDCKITSQNCGSGAPPGPPPPCNTTSSQPMYPNPSAIYDTENYTPDMCFANLDTGIVKVNGNRSVKNQCPYTYDQYGNEIPDTCTEEFTSYINIFNTVPWLSSIADQTIKSTSGLLRIWNFPNLYEEGAEDNPYNPIPAKDAVSYSYNQTSDKSLIDTWLANGSWDLLFAYMGGVVNAQKYLVNKVINPLASWPVVYPPGPPAPPSMPPVPVPSPSPGASLSPGQSPSPVPSTSPSGSPVIPPPPTPVSPPPVQFNLCSAPRASEVNDPTNRNYVFSGYTGNLTRQDDNAHSDKPFKAVIVEWPGRDYRFIFSQEAGANDPFFEFTGDKSGLKFGFYKASSDGHLYNRYGRLTDNHKLTILKNTPNSDNSVVIQWEYWNVNKDTGERINHAVEYYTFYPCGLMLREMKFLETIKPNGYSYQPISISLMNPQNTRWYEHIKKIDEWYNTYTVLDVNSANISNHFAKPIDGQLNKSEIKEEGAKLSEAQNWSAKITRFHLNKADVFLIYGDSAGLKNDSLIDSGKVAGHPCLNSSIIGWINSEREECNSFNFSTYPNDTPLMGINHQPENDSGGQHNFTLMGISSTWVGDTDEQLRTLAKQWLNQDFFK